MSQIEVGTLEKTEAFQFRCRLCGMLSIKYNSLKDADDKLLEHGKDFHKLPNPKTGPWP